MCEHDCCKCCCCVSTDFHNIKQEVKNSAGFISICPEDSVSFVLKMSTNTTFYLNPCITRINRLGYKMTKIDSYGKTVNMTFSKC